MVTIAAMITSISLIDLKKKKQHFEFSCLCHIVTKLQGHVMPPPRRHGEPYYVPAGRRSRLRGNGSALDIVVAIFIGAFAAEKKLGMANTTSFVWVTPPFR